MIPTKKIHAGTHYGHSQKCPNCGTMNDMEIPKGTTIQKFLMGAECFYCGCDIGKIVQNLFKDK